MDSDKEVEEKREKYKIWLAKRGSIGCNCSALYTRMCVKRGSGSECKCQCHNVKVTIQ